MASKSLIGLLVLLLIGILPRTVSSISMDELDATLASLRSRGHNLFSNAVTTSDAVFDILSAASITILLPTESSLFALDMTQPASFYVDTLRCHVIPRRLTSRALTRLAEGSYLPTLLPYRELRVTRRRDVVALDGVDVAVTGIFYGRRVAVHGLDGIFSFRSLITVGFNPQISPVSAPPMSGESDLFPHNRSGSVSPAPEIDFVGVLSPADRDLAILSPNSFRPVDAPVSDPPISESGEVSPVSESPETFPISALSPYISPSFLTEPDDPVSPSPSISDEIAETIEDLSPMASEMLRDTEILPDFVESPEVSPEISPSSNSISAEIAPSLQSKLSLGHLAPSVSSPEIEDKETSSPTIGDRDPVESEDLPSAISELLNDSEISPISWSPEISPSSHSERSPTPLIEIDEPTSPSPTTGNKFLLPAAPEFLSDSFRKEEKLSPPATDADVSPDSPSPEVSPTSHSDHSAEKDDLTSPPPVTDAVVSPDSLLPEISPTSHFDHSAEKDDLTSPPPVTDAVFSPDSLLPELSPTSHSDHLAEKDDVASPPPATGDGVQKTEPLNLPPAAVEFIRDSIRDTADLWPPATPDSSMPPAELFEAAAPSEEHPAMKPPLKGEERKKKVTAVVEMMAPEQSWPSTGETIECLVTGGDSVSCDLNNAHAAAAASASVFPNVFPQ